MGWNLVKKQRTFFKILSPIQVMEIDTNAMLNSIKALSVIFIILICVSNSMLLVKAFRKVSFYQSPKLMTIISLAAGDIMMAMFPLVVMAKLTFELDLSMFECRLNTAYETYYGYLLHFVYSMGLISLGIEVLIRSKLRSLCSPSLTAVVMGGVPWFSGLIIILPLCMAKMDYVRCINYESLASMYTIAVFLPASLAVVLLIIFNFIRLPVDEQVHQPVIDSDLQPTSVDSHEVIALQQISSNNAESNVIGASSDYQTATYHNVQNPAPGCSHFPYQPYSPNYQDVAQYSPMQQGQVLQTTATVVHQTQPGDTTYVPDMRSRELQRLLRMSIIFFLMVVPYAAIILSTGGDIFHSKSIKIAVQVFNWLMVARSCLTPLIMISYLDL
ncbi:hypothetical protein Btru_075964 [Bulinus truncatus]|nr:hypothetical protein Btru_075964 [Bulinus truncatus]